MYIVSNLRYKAPILFISIIITIIRWTNIHLPMYSWWSMWSNVQWQFQFQLSPILAFTLLSFHFLSHVVSVSPITYNVQYKYISSSWDILSFPILQILTPHTLKLWVGISVSHLYINNMYTHTDHYKIDKCDFNF